MSLPEAGPVSVMVVDDVPGNVSVLLEVLAGAGFRVLVAESGESALAQLEYATPGAIVLDVLMPGIDGFETCRRIKAEPRWAEIPVIFMTALSDPVDKVKGFEVGGADYVSKPVFCDEVLARIRAHVGLRSLRSDLQERNRLLQEEVRQRRETEQQLRRSLDSAVAVASSDGQLLFCSRLAELLLQKYFADANGSLPGALRDWFWPAQGLPNRKPFHSRLGDAELSVRLFAEEGGADCFMLLLEQRDPLRRFDALCTLGLTEREAEVLFWIAQGKTNPEIGVILSTAANTVKKHTQNILQKLSVETRTAAARLALDVLARGR